MLTPAHHTLATSGQLPAPATNGRLAAAKSRYHQDGKGGMSGGRLVVLLYQRLVRDLNSENLWGVDGGLDPAVEEFTANLNMKLGNLPIAPPARHRVANAPNRVNQRNGDRNNSQASELSKTSTVTPCVASTRYKLSISRPGPAVQIAV